MTLHVEKYVVSSQVRFRVSHNSSPTVTVQLSALISNLFIKDLSFLDEGFFNTFLTTKSGNFEALWNLDDFFTKRSRTILMYAQL